MSSDTGPRERQPDTLEFPDANTLRIMISTDNHLGFNERDAVRGMDSFAAFEEVMFLAKRYKCDMVLLAGDLFHENRPTRTTLFRTMEIIRRYCMGDDPVRVRILSDPSKTFASNEMANYQDPNYSVDLPVFSIHGNHDDPIREGQGTSLLAALDLLAVSNLVNYIGKQEKIDQVEISPVLLNKGSTRVALFSLGSMRDERLNRMWNKKKVRFLRPAEDMDDDQENEEGFFNIFTLHQNRDLGRGKKNCVQETMIPEWMDLVVWGHEHECLIELFESVVGTFRITQPGSSVATSLVAGEAVRKNVGILDILGKQFRLTSVPLTQVRPFVTTDVSLREHPEELDPDDPRINEQLISVLQEEVKVLTLDALDRRKVMLEDAKKKGNNANDEGSGLVYRLEKPNQPLVRLRVDHTGFSTLSNQRFGAHFVGQVANPEDILLFHRKKVSSQTGRRVNKSASEPIPPEELVKTDMDDLVNSLLEAPESKLKLFSEKSMGEAVVEFVDKKVALSIDDAADQMLKKRQKALIHAQTEETPSKTEKSKGSQDDTPGKQNDEAGDEDERTPNRKPGKRSRAAAESTDGWEDEDVEEPPPKSTRGGRTRKAAAAKAPLKRKATRRETVADSDSEVEVVEPKRNATRPKARATGRRGRARSSQVDSDEDEMEVDNGEDDFVANDHDDDMFDDDPEPPKRTRRKPPTRSTGTSRARTTQTRKKTPASRSRASRTRYDDSDEEPARNSLEAEDEDWGTVS